VERGPGRAGGQAHHTHHHSKFNYNYGQFFTFWDRVGNTYLSPEEGFARDRAKVERLKSKKAGKDE